MVTGGAQEVVTVRLKSYDSLSGGTMTEDTDSVQALHTDSADAAQWRAGPPHER